MTATPPPHGHPTLHRCPDCPSYMNHDGEDGLYCPHEAEHATPAPAPDGQALEARLAGACIDAVCMCGDRRKHLAPCHLRAEKVAAALAPVVAAEVERAVGEALESAAVRIEGRCPHSTNHESGICFECAVAARVVREGGPR